MLYSPRDPTARAELVVDMLTGESPNLTTRNKCSPLYNKARAASQTAAPRPKALRLVRTKKDNRARQRSQDVRFDIGSRPRDESK